MAITGGSSGGDGNFQSTTVRATTVSLGELATTIRQDRALGPLAIESEETVLTRNRTRTQRRAVLKRARRDSTYSYLCLSSPFLIEFLIVVVVAVAILPRWPVASANVLGLRNTLVHSFGI